MVFVMFVNFLCHCPVHDSQCRHQFDFQFRYAESRNNCPIDLSHRLWQAIVIKRINKYFILADSCETLFDLLTHEMTRSLKTGSTVDSSTISSLTTLQKKKKCTTNNSEFIIRHRNKMGKTYPKSASTDLKKYL